MRFSVFIVYDITANLREHLKNNEFLDMVDGDGMVRIEHNLNLYMEVVSYQKMIESAKNRNAALFKSLKLAP
jgi:hypothetical protein